MSRSLRNFITSVLSIVAVAIVTLLYYFASLQSLYPTWTKISYVVPGGVVTNQTSMPVLLPEQPLTVVITTEFELPEIHPKHFYIRQDDCLSNLTINDTRYTLPATPYCDYWKGLYIDLSGVVRAGANRMTFVVTNHGGPGGINFEPAGSDPLFRALRLKLGPLLAMCGLLLAFSWIRLKPEKVQLPTLVSLPHIPLIISTGIFGAVLLLAMAVRYFLTPYETADARNFLYGWYDFIITNGQFHSFRWGFADYAPGYLYFLSLASFLDGAISKLTAIKLTAMFFDFFLAYGVYRIVFLRRANTALPVLAFFVVLFAPTVWLNSACWGQCDSVYGSFIVWSVYGLLTKRPLFASLALGAAFSFKMQAIFFLPLFFYVASLGQFQLVYLLTAPLVYIVSVMPAWLAGRPFIELLLVYPRQTSVYRNLSKGAPNIWSWFPDDHYDLFYPAGVALALAAVLVVWFLVRESRRRLSQDLLISLTLSVSLIVPYLLPKMHERYFYTADVFSIIFAFYFPRYFWLPIAMQAISAFSYFPFLTGRVVLEQSTLVICLTVIVAISVRHLLLLLFRKEPDARRATTIGL